MRPGLMSPSCARGLVRRPCFRRKSAGDFAAATRHGGVLERLLLMRVTLLALLAACAAPPHPLLAGPPPKTAGCAEGPEVTDALGETVRLGDQQLTTVIIFLSRGAADEGTEFVRR